MSAADNPFLFEPDNRTPVTVMLDPATAARLEAAMAEHRETHPHADDDALCDLIFSTGLHCFEQALKGMRTAATRATEEGQTNEEWDANDFPLPDWAKRRSDGTYMEIGAQLTTRDGRRCGNAYIDEIEEHETLGQIAVVVTDMGNRIHLTARELEAMFYPPDYVMRLQEARDSRIRITTAEGTSHAEHP